MHPMRVVLGTKHIQMPFERMAGCLLLVQLRQLVRHGHERLRQRPPIEGVPFRDEGHVGNMAPLLLFCCACLPRDGEIDLPPT